MAKTSMIERQKKRVALVDEVRRQARRAEGDRRRTRACRAKSASRRSLKLAKLPRNSSATRLHNRCEVTGRPRAYYRKLRMSRIALRDLASQGPDPGHGQVELVRGADMSMNDPLGDMLTRIRNASMRGKSTVRTPASKIRKWVLDVLQAEGYIRGYEEVTSERRPPRARDRAQVLRRPAGHPRAAAGSPRPAAASTPASRRSRRSARASASPSSRRRRASCPMHRPAPPMSAAKSSAPCSEEGQMSRIGKKPVDLPGGVTATRLGPDGRGEGRRRAPAASPRPTT